MSKFVIYKGHKVMAGTDLYAALEAKEDKKADHLNSKLNDAFLKDWKGYEHLLKFRIGDQPK